DQAARRHAPRRHQRVQADVGADVVEDLAGLDLGADPTDGALFLDEQRLRPLDLDGRLAAERVAVLAVVDADLLDKPVPHLEAQLVEPFAHARRFGVAVRAHDFPLLVPLGVGYLASAYRRRENSRSSRSCWARSGMCKRSRSWTDRKVRSHGG